MRIKNRMMNLLYIAVFVIISGYGLALTLGINEGNLSILPMPYSNLSNIICFLYFFVSLVHGIVIQYGKGSSEEICIFPHLKGAVTMCVTVTFVISHFILSRGSLYFMGMNGIDWQNLIIHYMTPMMSIAHWLVFDKKGIYSFKDPVIWIAIPIGYLLFSFIYAEVGTVFYYNGTLRYPYYFINPDLIGWWNVIAYVAVLVVFFLILGYFVFFVDKYMEKIGKSNYIKLSKN